ALRIGATAPFSTGVISGWLHPSGAARSLCAEGTYRSLLTLTCLASRKLRARVKTRFVPAKRPASKESLRQYPIEGVDLVGSGFTRGDQRIARCGREPAPACLLGIAPVRDPFRPAVTHPNPPYPSGYVSNKEQGFAIPRPCRTFAPLIEKLG